MKLQQALSYPAAPPAPLGEGPKVDVIRAFACIFQQEEWPRLLLLCSAYIFIPIAGFPILRGYAVRLFRYMVLVGDDRKLPPPDRLDDLLGLGIAPYAASMIWSMPISLVFFTVLSIGVLISILFGMAVLKGLVASGTDRSAAGAAGVVVGAVSLFMVFMIFYFLIFLAGYFTTAMETLVEVTGKTEYAWKIGDIGGYIRSLQPEYRRSFIYFQLYAIVVTFIGSLFCFIGIFPAIAVLVVAAAHFRAQLYRIYLARGGSPLPVDQRL